MRKQPRNTYGQQQSKTTRRLNVDIADIVSTRRLKLARVRNGYFCSGFTKLSSIAAYFLDDVISSRNFTKDHVLPIQPRCFASADEKLRPI
jgi:hypothetical protein